MAQFEDVKSLLGESNNYYLIAVDMNGNYSYLNKRYSSIFEPLHGDLIGCYYDITIHPDDKKTCENVSRLAFEQPGKLFPATLRKHDGRGGYVITRWEYQAMFNSDMEPEGIFCIGHDITELVEIEIELENERFLRSHKLRKPVANLLGLCKLLNNEELSADQSQIVNMIHESAQELDREIRDSKPG